MPFSLDIRSDLVFSRLEEEFLYEKQELVQQPEGYLPKLDFEILF